MRQMDEHAATVARAAARGNRVDTFGDDPAQDAMLWVADLRWLAVHRRADEPAPGETVWYPLSPAGQSTAAPIAPPLSVVRLSLSRIRSTVEAEVRT
jgi:hypothetical protein